jgi:hypothetical protein
VTGGCLPDGVTCTEEIQGGFCRYADEQMTEASECEICCAAEECDGYTLDQINAFNSDAVHLNSISMFLLLITLAVRALL